MAWLARFVVRARHRMGEIIPYRIVKVQKPAPKTDDTATQKAGGRVASPATEGREKPKFTDPTAERLFRAVLARRKEANEILARH